MFCVFCRVTGVVLWKKMSPEMFSAENHKRFLFGLRLEIKAKMSTTLSQTYDTRIIYGYTSKSFEKKNDLVRIYPSKCNPSNIF